MRRAFLVVLDGVGIGTAPDSVEYGDDGADTLGHVLSDGPSVSLPTLSALGLGRIRPLRGVPEVEQPGASFGTMREVSAGKDSVTGHWELTGVVGEHPFPTYPDGFPPEIVELVEEVSGRRTLGNEAASGTEIMERLGGEHLRTGALILYTSADSVLQLLAHEQVVPLPELYRICTELRERLLPPHNVGRVIARPFIGEEGAFVRTANRKDFALEPTAVTVLDRLVESGIPVRGIGKVDTLFAGRGFSDARRTPDNAAGIAATLEQIQSSEPGLTFTNLLDFDTLWGHRNDVHGFARGLVEADRGIASWLEALRPDDILILTADHGNDPTYPGTDHTREFVPLLALLGRSGTGSDLGERNGFMDVAATLAEWFGIDWDGPGRSFLAAVSGMEAR